MDIIRSWIFSKPQKQRRITLKLEVHEKDENNEALL